MWLKFISGLILCVIFYLLNNYYKQAFRNADNVSPQFKEEVLTPPNVEVPQPPSASTLHVYEKAAVCSDNSICSNIGSAILQHGGSAIDGAIATLICNGLVTMQSMGIGGGVIITYYQRKTKKAVAIIGRERAPLNTTLMRNINGLQNASNLAQSALSIAVPGELAAYYEAHKRYGKLSWHYLIKPTLKICCHGYHLTRHQRDALFSNEFMIRKDKLLTQMFIDPETNLFHKEGYFIKLPNEVCKTYKLLMKEGPLTFYKGSLSTAIVRDFHDMCSPITKKDLMAYKADVKDAFVVDLEPFYIYLPPPPSSGHVVGFIIEILKKFQQEFAQTIDLGALEIHRIVEALKFGFVKRWQYDAEADSKTLKQLLASKSIKKIANLIDDFKTFNDTKHYGHVSKLKPLTDHGTAHVSILAPNGDAVSITSSINYYFGSGRMGSRTGILFNNVMSDFTIPHFENYFKLPNIDNINHIKPGKQPMSSMAPLIVTNKKTGNVRLVVGAAGGSRIISSLTQILVRVLWLQQNIKQAIDAPRFHHQLLPNLFEYEYGLLQQILDELEERGHKTARLRRKCTTVCGVEKTDDGVILANADFRKEGGVDGF